MYRIGEYQLLDVEEKTGSGFLLKHADEERTLLLPNGEILGQIDVGDSIMVFVYLDTEDRLIATMKESLAEAGKLSYLKLAELVDFGAFMDIGLQRDLFVPLKEINYTMKKNKSYLVYCYVDKSKRLCATTKVYDYLTVDHGYKANDTVTATVVRINPEIGVFVAVDNQYKGMIPKSEYFEAFSEGDVVQLRVIRVREDKKLDLATRQLVKDQMVVDSEKIYFELVKAGGRLNYHDKSDPAEIKAKFNMSKKAFKRAIGRLLKEEKVELYETYMLKKDESE
jgi:predicted RNA-binding protein (virulence factor B family)